GAVVPVPVPLVVEAVGVERPQRRRAGPQVVIDSFRDRGVGLVADARAVAGDPGAGHRHLAQAAALDELARATDVGGAAALGADLHDAVVFAGRLHHAPPLDKVVADRLLDVDVLAGLAGPDGGQGVPVVRGGDDQGGDVLVREGLAHVLLDARLA